MKKTLMKALSLLFFITLTGLGASNALAGPPALNYQGYLVDAVGLPVEGVHSFTFTLYDAAIAGNTIWTETQDLDLNGGYFHAYLGDSTMIDPTIFRDNPELHLGITVDGGAEFARTRLVSAPYAMNSDNATYSDSSNWAGLMNIPADLADGDDDTFSSIACGDSEILIYSLASGWLCTAYP